MVQIKYQFKQKNILLHKRIVFLTLIILLLGCFFRFYHLDHKTYWGDETVTSLRISGYSIEELQQKAITGYEFSVEELKQYQYPNQDKNLIDTITGLATEEPQHPPLYFILLKLWVKSFGDSVSVIRSFSAFISLLVFPGLYWLCSELFDQRSEITPPSNNGVISDFANPKYVAISLVAAAPFHIIYAQEARSYSLWTLTIILSSAALFHAIRKKTNLSWIIYTITLITSYYTFLFSGLIAIIHGLYLIIVEKFKFNNNIKCYLWSLFSSLIAFLPWTLAVYINANEADQTTGWTKKNVSLILLIKNWILNLNRVFIDLNYNFIERNILLYFFFLAILLIVFYSFINLARYTNKKTWLFIFLLTAIPSLSLVFLDLSSGGIRSTVARYFIPSYIGVELAVSYTVAHNIFSLSIKNWQRQMWNIIFLVIISSGLFSSIVYSEAEIWWNKYNGIHFAEVAEIVNQYSDSKIITSWHSLMIFSHILNPEIKIQSLSKKTLNLIQGESTNSSISEEELLREQHIFVHNNALPFELLTSLGYQLEMEYKWKSQIEPVYEIRSRLGKLVR